MPFIRGRYHINPIAGAALEAAREAEEALSASREAEDGRSPKAAADRSEVAHAPIHRVEIEAAEVVPSHSGRAQRGFVARIHRAASTAPAGSSSHDDDDFPGVPASAHSSAQSGVSQRTAPHAPETHVFSNHEDLTDFLRGEFQRDCPQ